MKLGNLKARIKFWSAHYGDTGAGDPAPFMELSHWQDLFKGKDILELGPGAGRQAFVVMPLANEFGVADIVQDVLELPLYADCWQYLLTTYRIDNRDRDPSWDVAMAWDVIRYVPRKEGAAFIRMLAGALRTGGMVMFNAPGDVDHLDASEPAETLAKTSRKRGILPTGWTPTELMDLAEAAGLKLTRVHQCAGQSIIYVGQK